MAKVDFDTVTGMMREVAEEHILPYFGKLEPSHIAFKIGDDPVTIADKNAESALSARLLDLLPGSKVVGEEAFAADNGVLQQLFSESPVWIIDPIDGTRNFVGGKRQFGVIVALAEHNQTVAGWIYDPTSKEVVTAERGSGAFYKGKRLAVKPAATFSEMQGFLGDRLVWDYEKRKSDTPTAPHFEMMTAGAHEYPRLILNQPHFGGDFPQSDFRASKFHSTPWDDAAGVLMYEEAGGYAAHWNGDAYRPATMHKGVALAPSKESWLELKAWVSSFSELP